VNNEPQAIPKYLGAAPQPTTHCFYAIHTHDSSGKIHVTPAAPGIFTLGELFEIWGQPLTNTNVAGVTGLPVEIYVTDNGTSTKVEEADWSDIKNAPTEALVNGLSMMSPYGAREKQALLEAPDLKTRAEILIAVTEMDLAKKRTSGDTGLQ
jgi:hypothetical protein